MLIDLNMSLKGLIASQSVIGKSITLTIVVVATLKSRKGDVYETERFRGVGFRR